MGFETYKFLVEVEVKFKDNSTQFIKFEINKRNQNSEFRFRKKPVALIFDPHRWILGTFVQDNE